MSDTTLEVGIEWNDDPFEIQWFYLPVADLDDLFFIEILDDPISIDISTVYNLGIGRTEVN